MTKRDKLRRKLRNNLKGRTKQEIETLLSHFGFRLDRISGSHHIFIFRDGEIIQRIVVPIHGQKIKPIYVKQVIEKIDELFPEDHNDNLEVNDDE
ncbi:MAG: type II toxin-antitoxin system HicA family toxin [Chitinophagaceae bacterium]|nr:type II toxin-antitoxin system HicA family toxin [Anaerolineae bacterium]